MVTIKKSTPLAIFIICINKCFEQLDCNNCTAYSIDHHTCKYSNPFTLLKDSDSNSMLYVYSKEHMNIDCTKCTVKDKNGFNSICVYNITKILNKLRNS